jgi:hypothetical protein
LLDDRVPQGGDSSWMRAAGLDSGEVYAGMIWRAVDEATVELLVRRPLDSTTVRFRPGVTAAPLSDEPRPAGVVLAVARRVICR